MKDFCICLPTIKPRKMALYAMVRWQSVFIFAVGQAGGEGRGDGKMEHSDWSVGGLGGGRCGMAYTDWLVGFVMSVDFY